VNEVKTPTREHAAKIIELTGIAPKDHQWLAWFGDYDENTAYGHGATEAEAMMDLIANHDLVAS
jgi:hypothetical protein